MGERLRLLTTTALAAVAAGCLVHLAPVVATTTTAVLLLGLLAWLGRVQVATWRAARGSRLVELFGTPVRIVADSASAFTAGPLVPVVFVGERLVDGLSTEELRAVVLHEAAHRQRFDPLRTLVVHLFRFVLSAETVANAEARREITADRRAMARGATRGSLASALLNVGAAPARSVGFAPVAQLRVRALLDGSTADVLPTGRWSVVAAVGAGLVICSPWLHAAIIPVTTSCC